MTNEDAAKTSLVGADNAAADFESAKSEMHEANGGGAIANKIVQG
jgi:hypothetical protein